MKKINNVLPAIFLIIVIGSVRIMAQTEPVKVGLCMANLIDDRWFKDRDYFIEKIKALNAIPIVRDASNMSENQLQQAKELIDSGVSVLVVIPIDGIAAGAIVAVAHQAGVKVIAYDRLIKNVKLDYYISFNSVTVGEIMASYVTNISPFGNYIFINGPVEDNNSLLIETGVMNILKPWIERNKINDLYQANASEWIELSGYLIMTDYFQDHSENITAIICGADILAKGVLMSLDEHDLTGKILLTGQDATLMTCQDIVRNRQTLTIYKPIKYLAESAANFAVQIARNEPGIKTENTTFNGIVDVPSILFDPILVDKNNMKETIVKDGYWSEEQVYGK